MIPNPQRRGFGFALVLVLAASAAGATETADSLSEPARWLREYLRIDTTNPPGGEHRAAAFLADILRRERIPSELITTPSGRTSLVARLAASAPSREGALVLTHHMDVVPAGRGWTVQPFGGEVVSGRVWGRGAIDTKGLGIAHLAALIDLKRRGVPLKRDVVFLAVADEEAGGSEGMAWLARNRPELFDNVAAVFNEGGAGRLVPRGLLWWEIEVAQKRPLWLRLRAEGRAGHASSYSPDSAVHFLIQALDRLLAMPRPFRVSEPARQYFHAIGPLHQGKNRELFQNIDSAVTPEGLRGVFLPGLQRLLVDTLQVTRLSAGEAINVIADEAVAEVDIRLLPDTDADAFLARVREALGKQVDITVLLTAPVSAPSPTGNSVWKAIEVGLKPDAPVVPAMSGGFTDSRHFRERGIPAYGVSPFALSPEDAAGIHAGDERMPLDELERGIARMKRIVSAFVVENDRP